jgi:hypothetical protein
MVKLYNILHLTTSPSHLSHHPDLLEQTFLALHTFYPSDFSDPNTLHCLDVFSVDADALAVLDHLDVVVFLVGCYCQLRHHYSHDNHKTMDLVVVAVVDWRPRSQCKVYVVNVVVRQSVVTLLLLLFEIVVVKMRWMWIENRMDCCRKACCYFAVDCVS